MAIKVNAGILVPAPTPSEYKFWESYKTQQSQNIKGPKNEQSRDDS